MLQNVEICIKCFICTTKHTPFFGCTISFLSFEQAFLYVNMLEGLNVCAIEYNTTISHLRCLVDLVTPRMLVHM